MVLMLRVLLCLQNLFYISIVYAYSSLSWVGGKHEAVIFQYTLWMCETVLFFGIKARHEMVIV